MILLFRVDNFLVHFLKCFLLKLISLISFFIRLKRKRIDFVLYILIFKNWESYTTDMVIVYFIDYRAIGIPCNQFMTVIG